MPLGQQGFVNLNFEVLFSSFTCFCYWLFSNSDRLCSSLCICYHFIIFQSFWSAHCLDSGLCNRLPYTGSFNKSAIFLTTLEAGEYEIKVLVDLMFVFRWLAWSFLCEEVRERSGSASPLTKTPAFRRAHPADLITPQRLCLLIALLRFQYVNCGNIQSIEAVYRSSFKDHFASLGMFIILKGFLMAVIFGLACVFLFYLSFSCLLLG